MSKRTRTEEEDEVHKGVYTDASLTLETLIADMLHVIHDKLGALSRFVLRRCSKTLRDVICRPHRHALKAVREKIMPVEMAYEQTLIDEVISHGSPELMEFMYDERWFPGLLHCGHISGRILMGALRSGRMDIARLYAYNGGYHTFCITFPSSEEVVNTDLHVPGKVFSPDQIAEAIGQYGSREIVAHFDNFRKAYERAEDFLRGICLGDRLELLLEEKYLPVAAATDTIDEDKIVQLIQAGAVRCLTYLLDRFVIGAAMYRRCWHTVLTGRRVVTARVCEAADILRARPTPPPVPTPDVLFDSVLIQARDRRMDHGPLLGVIMILWKQHKSIIMRHVHEIMKWSDGSEARPLESVLKDAKDELVSMSDADRVSVATCFATLLDGIASNLFISALIRDNPEPLILFPFLDAWAEKGFDFKKYDNNNKWSEQHVFAAWLALREDVK